MEIGGVNLKNYVQFLHFKEKMLNIQAKIHSKFPKSIQTKPKQIKSYFTLF